VNFSARIVELARFALVGSGATLLYGAIGLVLLHAGMAATSSSVIAYCLAGALSYCGHKFFTFGSQGEHAKEAPRFVLVNGFGFACALLAPQVATGILRVDARWAIAFTCVAVPAFSYFAMKRLVFTRAATTTPPRRHAA
jgi:putative flippase GtrA